MFGTFFEESDYTLDEVIKEINEEINDHCLVKASMDYHRHIHELRSIVEALEIVRKNQKKRGDRMTLQELKTVARRKIAKWCNELPQDGDYKEPEVITDRMSGDGAPEDGDYVVIMIFHNRN